MLLRVCTKDKIPLVCVVRKVEQETMLKSINAHAIVVNQSSPNFVADLAKAMQLTGATLAFDATGGGSLSSNILSAFDQAGQVTDGIQVYAYGGLDTSPSTLSAA